MVLTSSDTLPEEFLLEEFFYLAQDVIINIP